MSDTMGDKLKEAMEEHQKIVDKLQDFANRKSITPDKNSDLIKVFENELDNLKSKFENLSKHYEFAILQEIIVKTVFDLINALIEAFIVTNNKEK